MEVIMPEQVPFIGREDELALIDKLIKKWDTLCIFCIDALGGIGKTRLLQEIRKRYLSADHDHLIVMDIIDFDDHTFHTPQKIGRKIAQMLDDETIFKPYLDTLLDYRKMEMAGVSSEYLAQTILKGNNIFIDCFNKISEQKRVIIFFDTTDALEGTDIWNYLMELYIQLKNVLILVAGRNARSNGELLQTKVDEDVYYIVDLPPLNEKTGEEYLLKKQELLHIRLDSELSQKLLLMAGGLPILIDLAVEWIVRKISLGWIDKTSLAELKSISDNEIEVRQEEFTRQLVLHIAQTRTQIDRLVLLMSHVYPLNVEIIAKLLVMTKYKAENLLTEAITYVFVKSLPDGRITLHDEMRRMVNYYVWPETDPEGDQRRWYSKFATEYLESVIKTLSQKITELENKEKIAQEKKNAEAKMNAFAERLAIEHEIWIIKAEHLKHTLLVDIDKGVKTFIYTFDKATLEHHFNFRRTLLVQMQHWADKFSIEQLYELNIRRIQALLYRGEYLPAKEIVTGILGKGGISPEQRVNMLVQLGNIEMRIGDYSSGVDEFSEAVKICHEHRFEEQNQLKEYSMRSRHALGWGYRMIGDFDDAIKEYETAQELSISLDDKLEEAWILNDLAFAHTLNGNIKGAFSLAEQAKDQWQMLGDKQGLGALYQVYSEISKYSINFDQSIAYSNKALEIFEPLGNIDWLNRIYLTVGICYWGRADLNAAEVDFNETDQDLKNAEENLQKTLESKGRYRIEALHYLGHVYLTRDNIYGKYLDKAEELFTIANEESKKASLNDIQLNSLGYLVYIAIKKGEINKLEAFEAEYKEFLEKWSNKRYTRGNEGLLLKYLGDLNLSKTSPDINAAINNYVKGLPLISTITFKTYSLVNQLKDIEKRLSGSADFNNAKVKLGKKLDELWKKDAKIAQLHPDARRFFIRWQQGETKNV